MPKFQREWIETVVYLFGSIQDARNPRLEESRDWPQFPGETGANAASGCLVEIDTAVQAHQYVVTNQHVVKAGLCKPRFLLAHDTENVGYVIDAVEDEWCMDTATDLAALPVCDPKVTHGARGLKLSGQGKHILPLDRTLARAEVDVGDDVAMPGRFYPVSGGPVNQPVTRFGNVATWPATTVRLSWMSEPVDAILVEMRSHSGYSGSPVFVFRGVNDQIDHLTNMARGSYWSNASVEVDWRDVRFMGIDCGHVSENMAVVIPWFKVVELLESPGLKRARENLDSKLEESLPPRVMPD